MKNITILGAGLIGLPMARDLITDKQFHVKLIDIRKDRLEEIQDQYGMDVFPADLSDDRQLLEVISDADIVVSSVPGYMGFQTLKRIIQAGKTTVDIAFFPEDLFLLDNLAKEKGVTVVSDIGVAPGMSNILSVHSHNQLDRTDRIRIYVGGLPVARNLPFEYKAGFSPIDVIEEYTRPARYIREGKLIEMPALSEPELLNFKGIGTLEAFNSDGLRSLIHTLPCPDMVEKTLRYPGHIEKVRLLREIGLFSHQPVKVKGTVIRPIDLASELLFPLWELGEDEDLTVMKIIVEGLHKEKMVKITWDLLDYFDRENDVHSMARTTGYTATAAVRMLAQGLYTRKGISPPEYLAEHEEHVNFLLDDLKTHNINYHQTIEEKED
jgi:saccharopine dehydrogenase-like NADP-dependent oxidoreductase